MIKRAIAVLICCFVFSTPAWALVINQLELEGITVFSQTDIESLLEVGPGDKLDKKKVVKTVKNLERLYQSRGYNNVKIRSELQRKRDKKRLIAILKFVVVEGDPVRIAGFRFVPVNIESEELRLRWEDASQDLVDRVQLKNGMILGRDKINDVSREIEIILAEREYIGVNVVNVRRLVSESTLKLKASQWIMLEFQIDLGKRVTFGFRDNERFSNVELNDLIDEQRLLGFGTDYIDSIKNRIVDKYRSKGYASIQVEVLTFEKIKENRRHVTFVINEGKRVRIESVDFDGNFAFSDDDLRDRFFDFAPLLVNRGYFVEKDVNKTTASLIEWLNSKGYLAAKLVSIQKKFDDRKKHVNLTVFVYEGQQTKVRKVVVEGSTVFNAEEVGEYLTIQEKGELNLFAFTSGLERLKAAYRDRGYLDMAVANEDDKVKKVVRYSRKNEFADIFIQIREGQQYRVGKVDVAGLEDTKEHIVLREVEFKAGDVLEEYRISESERNIRRLGIFSGVNIQHRPDPKNSEVKNVTVYVKEGTPGEIGGGLGIRNDLGLRAFGEVSYANLWSRNHLVSLKGDTNQRLEEDASGFGGIGDLEYEVSLSYRWPWFLSISKLNFRPVLSFEKRRFESTLAQTAKIAANFDRVLIPAIKLSGALTYALEAVQQEGTTVQDTDFQLGTIGPSLEIDLRDNPLTPKKGFYARASFEWVAPEIGAQNDPFPMNYTRFQTRADYVVPLWRNATWLFSVRIGAATNFADPNDASRNYSDVERLQIGIPTVKQFTLGGVGSLRGFNYQALNYFNSQVQGTLNYVNYRTQIDFPVAGNLKMGPFLDAGNLLLDKFSLGRLRYGAGIGIHYDTPVGPINFDWGVNLFPTRADSAPDDAVPVDEDTNRFHFSVGIL